MQYCANGDSRCERWRERGMCSFGRICYYADLKDCPFGKEKQYFDGDSRCKWRMEGGGCKLGGKCRFYNGEMICSLWHQKLLEKSAFRDYA